MIETSIIIEFLQFLLCFVIALVIVIILGFIGFLPFLIPFWVRSIRNRKQISNLQEKPKSNLKGDKK